MIKKEIDLKMGLTLIIAEKPSQAKAYADAFQHVKREDGYFQVEDSRFFNGTAMITWGFGHLVELVQPERYNEAWKVWDLQTLPMIPGKFEFQVAADKRKQFNIVKKLLKEADEIIVATDCDREGENIARSIIQMAGASHKPTKRLWINSLEVDEIQKGFQALKEGEHYLSLYKEAQTRQFSDWLVGMNASRLYTLLLQQKGMLGAFSVGRVQTPTLYLIYQRQQEIKKFKPEPFYEWMGHTSVKNGLFEAKYKERFATKEKAREVLAKYHVMEGKNQGTIQKVEKTLKKTKSPKLHSLSTLQTVANKRWKYSPSEVLKIAQSLYEKKLLTYPRTDTHYITDNEFAYLKQNVSNYQTCMGIKLEIAYPDAQKRFVDGSKVQEHYALVPTKQVAKLETLSEQERNIYEEVMRTTLAMFAPDYEYEETKVEVHVNGLIFEKTGKVEKKKGWKSLFQQEKENKNEQEALLPSMEEGERCTVDVMMKESMTQAPKPYTEGALIQVMKRAGKEVEDEEAKDILKETEGIGTEATRAAIIETLKYQKYIEVKKNIVHVTEKGKILCQAVEGTLLASPEMTAKWESYLKKIGQGNGSQHDFLQKIKAFLQILIDHAPKRMNSLQGQVDKLTEESSVGSCPVCQKGKVIDKGKFYGCSRYKEGCTFTLPKTFCGKTLSKTHIKALLEGKRTSLIKGFKSKKGKKFEAYLKVDSSTGKIMFDFPKK